MVEKTHAKRELSGRPGKASCLAPVGFLAGMAAIVLLLLGPAGHAVTTRGTNLMASELLEQRGEEQDALFAQDDEIPITDEMIEAGEVALLGYDPRFGNLDTVARRVFEAMEKARRRGGLGQVRSRQ